MENNIKENIVFVHASPEDSRMFHLYQTMLHTETNYYLQNSKESERIGTDKVKEFILDSLKSPSSALFILKDMNTREVLAHIQIQIGTTARNKHKGELYIGVLEQYQGIGVGLKLMEIADFWARKENIEKLVLYVFANNEKAINFYKKIGYQEEGRLKNSIKLDNNLYTDEIIMSKFVEPFNLELTPEALNELENNQKSTRII